MILTTAQLPERRPYDRYPTPEWLAEAALDLIETPPEWVLDVGAGNGVWGRAAQHKWPLARIYGVEIQDSPWPDAYNYWHIGDFLQYDIMSYDLIMGNPPYKDAEAFIDHAQGLLRRGGEIVFLLRLAFLEGQKRRDGLFKRWPPRHVAICSRRPSFNEDGKGTNATAFAVMCWTLGHAGPTTVSWL